MNEGKRFIRLPEVLNRTGLCKAWIYRLISRNEFPAQVKLGERAIAFLESDIISGLMKRFLYHVIK